MQNEQVEQTTVSHPSRGTEGSGTPRATGRATDYTSSQRRYIALSVSLLVLIMVAVSFAAGVYIGNNREIAPSAQPGGPAVRPGAQAGPQRFGQPPADGTGAQAGVPGQQQPLRPGQQPAGSAFDVLGTVTGHDGMTLDVATPTGSVRLDLSEDVKIEDRTGQVLTVESLLADSRVGVVFRPGTLSPLLVVLMGQALP
ncbi:MAG: hypothetical protein ACE5EF_05585 [Dehalococcoidia bacterium]